MTAHILLTGSTGNLGSYVLAALASQSNVTAIHCLDRSSNTLSRQKERLQDRGLELAESEWNKVRFHRCTLDDAQLGLDTGVHDTLQQSVTHILHCAWPVDFNKVFESFLPSINGVARLIDFAAKAVNRPRLIFCSSVSAVGNWGALPGARHTVPEAEVDDWKAGRMGYGQSKLVTERLLADASRSQGITTAICRIGQVAGPIDHGVHGMWPKQEWLPSLVASSRALGKIPKSLGPLQDVDWIPVDRLASVITELVFANQRDGTACFYHAVNPTECSWGTLLPAILEHDAEKQNHPVETVSLPHWVDVMQEPSEDIAFDAAKNPALKLEEFFTNIKEKALYLPRARAARLEVKKTMAQSPTLADLGPVQPDWMTLWLQQWDATSA